MYYQEDSPVKERTSIAIDERLRREAHALARRRGVSLSALVTGILEDLLAEEPGGRKRFPHSVVVRSRPPGLPLARDHESIAFREGRR